MRVIVTGGGTGGHIYPALAIADKVVEKNPQAEILYVGTPNSLEEKIVTRYGYEFRSVEVKGFQRRLSLENIKRFFMASRAIRDSSRIIRDFRPDVVIGTGGYVSGPVVYAASVEGVKTIIHEQNAYPGITNRILSKRVDRVFLGFDIARKAFKTKAEVRTVGNPVRERIFRPNPRSEARRLLGLDPTRPFLLISGGSGGSDSINKVFVQMIPMLIEKEIGFIFSTGKRHYEKIMEGYGPYIVDGRYMIVDYIEDMSNYISASDLCIISAGAMTIAEINAVGRASIIIPKTYSTENHQEINAKNIQENGAGYYIREDDLKVEDLLGSTMKILEDAELREQMEKMSKDLYNIDPCEAIVAEIEKLV
ncbi:MAG: undecaprenyldiphospho-muramoylpentapeptide beta-N-acetylglucosaminyltransferase [Peptostreptococcaceae bacterium]|nr:undecaprenyldiphospho-muramoylpentapeptide beta-N-acetylglucosaminyltransferase [Peptostreptococcaceae bacterium]